MLRHRSLLLPVFLVLLLPLWGQVQFEPEQLNDPKRYGSAISSQLQTIEIPEFRDTTPSTFFLKNGFRSSSYLNGADWLRIADTVEVVRIDIVYSKYPLRNGSYSEIYPLLCSRLKHLFELDAGLNDDAIAWNKVLQTHCVNDQQVDQLLHGVLIWYRPIEQHEPVPVIAETDDPLYGTAESALAEQHAAVGYIMESELFSDSLKTALADKPLDQQRTIIVRSLEADLQHLPDEDRTKLTAIKRQQYQQELDKLVRIFRGDSTVSSVLTRHPEWQHLYVVNDWTGSMYGYSAQVLQWHLLHLETSGIEHITLFNDGDDLSTSRKKIGITNGIYSEKADNIERLIKLSQLVMMKGSGGDGPENDIEALLSALEQAPDSSEIILIADNYACIRDIRLADRIHVPVRVIICGYDPGYGINPDLVYLAKVTKGGLYTIEDDLENLQVEVNGKQQITGHKDNRFKVAKRRCDGGGKDAAETHTYSAFRQTRFKGAGRIESLDLANDSLGSLPKRIYKFRNLELLDLRANNLPIIDPRIGQLVQLRTLDLSDNHLQELPAETGKLKYLEELRAANNQLATWPTLLLNYPFLRKLDLSGNQLTEIGRITNLKRLREWDLSHNQLTTLPRSFQSLKSLKVLDLSNNQLNVVPLSICNLKNLEELDLRNNHLKELPAAMSGIRSLKILHLDGNAFTEEEKDVIRKRFGKVLVYF